MINSSALFTSKLKAFSILLLVAQLASAETVDRVVAIVENEPILLSDLSIARQQIKSEQGIDDLVFPDMSSQNKALMDEKFLVERLIQAKLVDSEIKRSDIKITDDMVEQQVRDIAKQNKLSRDQLKEALLRQGMVFEEYLRLTKRSLERRAFIERNIQSKVRISDEEVNNQLQKDSSQKVVEHFENQIARILISKKGKTDAQGKDRAQLAYDKIKAGSTFESVAADFSEDPDFTQGGLLGSFKTGELSPVFEEQIAKLNEGEVSQPFKTDDGYQIIKIVQRRSIPNPAVEGKRNEARAKLSNLAFRRQFESWIEQKKKNAFIKINL